MLCLICWCESGHRQPNNYRAFRWEEYVFHDKLQNKTELECGVLKGFSHQHDESESRNSGRSPRHFQPRLLTAHCPGPAMTRPVGRPLHMRRGPSLSFLKTKGHLKVIYVVTTSDSFIAHTLFQSSREEPTFFLSTARDTGALCACVQPGAVFLFYRWIFLSHAFSYLPWVLWRWMSCLKESTTLTWNTFVSASSWKCSWGHFHVWTWFYSKLRPAVGNAHSPPPPPRPARPGLAELWCCLPPPPL